MVQNKNILFKKEYAKHLFEIAKGDLDTASALLMAKSPGRIENILYMIQQSVEKSLKAVLIHKQISFPIVHDLGILIALLPVDDYPPGGFDWAELNPYASIRRYEEGSLPIHRDEIQAAFDAARLVQDWVIAQFQK
ncbi:MAG: HEPN domain-containing protein [Bdellovibrio sp.]|nr:HEPN domain-containing protein [Bdellovibrio sp.]